MAELLKISESKYRCSECVGYELRLYRDNVKKSPEEWEMAIHREFADHLRHFHTRREFQQFIYINNISL